MKFLELFLELTSFLESFSQENNVFSFDELLTSDISITSKMSFMKTLSSKDPEIKPCEIYELFQPIHNKRIQFCYFFPLL